MTPTYQTWHAMRQRCLDPMASNYKWFGARGITICERWSEFGVFLMDMGERPPGMTLDRIDVNGNYEPGNCRWADMGTQQRNKRPPTPEAIEARAASHQGLKYKHRKP
jgi:hypothetical protein